MNPIITEQLNKFKTGDFSGYENFYNETVTTVYTMLHTIIDDQNVTTSLVPQVYDKIYQNATNLEQTECFYQWAAGFANEEALGYLKENRQTEIRHDSAKNKNSQIITAGSQEETEQFYDYAVEDAALTITEEVVTDTSFVTRLQEIVNTLSPMERIAFQDYYYFGISVPEIATKTGCKDTDIRYTLSQARTSILQIISATPAYAAGYRNPNVRKYHLAQAPWMWIAYQNFLGYTLGIDTISIAGWAMGVLGQTVGSNIAISGMGAEGVIAGGASGAGAVSGASIAGAGATAGEISAGGTTIGATTAGGAGVAGTSGIATGFFGTIGGKIAIGIVGAAMATAIGVGVHHLVTENQTTTEIVTTTEMASEIPEQVTEPANVTTETATESTSETAETTAEAISTDYSLYDALIEEEQNSNSFISHYCRFDIDHDGIEEIIFSPGPIEEAGELYYSPCKIYSIKDNQVIQILGDNLTQLTDNTEFNLLQDGFICTSEMDNAPSTRGLVRFQYKNQQLTYIDSVIRIYDSSNQSHYYYIQNEENHKKLYSLISAYTGDQPLPDDILDSVSKLINSSPDAYQEITWQEKDNWLWEHPILNGLSWISL